MPQSYAELAKSVITSETYNYNGYGVPMTRTQKGIVYVNLTEMAKAFPNKNLTQIVNSQEVKEYCESLSKLQNYSFADLLIVKKGAPNLGGGTWAHQKVALRVAQKLSPDFAVWVDARIEELLLTGRSPLQRPLTPAQMFMQQAQLYLEQEQRLLEVESRISKIENKVGNSDFITVLGFANIHKLHIGNRTAAAIGKKAAKYCRDHGIEVEYIHDARHGRVGSYPPEALIKPFQDKYPRCQF